MCGRMMAWTVVRTAKYDMDVQLDGVQVLEGFLSTGYDILIR